MVLRKAALIATGIALDIAGYAGAASQPQMIPFENRTREMCGTLIEQQLSPAGAEGFAALKAMRAAADEASVFDYKDVASLRELLRRALAANRAADLYEQAFASVTATGCLSDPTFEKSRLQSRSEVAHWINLARDNLKAIASDGAH